MHSLRMETRIGSGNQLKEIQEMIEEIISSNRVEEVILMIIDLKMRWIDSGLKLDTEIE